MAIQEQSQSQLDGKLAQPEEQQLASEEDGKTVVTTGMLQGTADVVNISGDSIGPFTTHDLDKADEMSAISMAKTRRSETNSRRPGKTVRGAWRRRGRIVGIMTYGIEVTN